MRWSIFRAAAPRKQSWLASHVLSTPWLFLIGMLALFTLTLPLPARADHALAIASPALIAPIPADPSSVHLLAATAWAEARGEGEEGMRAVAHVIVNRVTAQRFGYNLSDVILHPKQFSAWNVGDPNRPLALDPERYAKAGSNRETWIEAQTVAREVLEGRSIDPTQGALFYHARNVKPYWADEGVGRRIIGNHVFYADVVSTPRGA